MNDSAPSYIPQALEQLKRTPLTRDLPLARGDFLLRTWEACAELAAPGAAPEVVFTPLLQVRKYLIIYALSYNSPYKSPYE